MSRRLRQITERVRSGIRLALSACAPAPSDTRRRGARVFTAAELSIDGEMREMFDAVRAPDGRHVSREFQRAGYGEIVPWRSIVRFISRAAKGDADEARVLAILERLTQFARDEFAKRPARRVA